MIQKEAIIDMREAFTWYEAQKEGLGHVFIGEVELCFQKLAMNPEYSSKINTWMRRMLVNGFPYIIIYETENENVYINSVFHTSRLPRY